MFELNNVKNKAILRDFLQKWKVECSAGSLVPMRLRFFHSTCVKYCACHEKLMPGHTKCCTCHAKSSQQTCEDLILQNATPLRKWAPWPPDISDEHIFCTAPATRNASLKILFKRRTPAKCPKSLTFCSLLTRCTILCACHVKQHLNLQKWSEPLVLSTFWLRNVLRATTACTFSTSQLPKVVREWCVLYIFTSTCASRHNGVHFFDIATSKSGPRTVCFVRFHFDMCFAPQRRALFRHRNFQKWSDTEVFCIFSLRHVLRATKARTFSTSQLLKVLWDPGVLYLFTSKSASRHNGVQLFISHLPRCLRTRRLASLLVDPPEPQNIEKHSVSRLSYLFAHLHLLSSDLFSSDFSPLWLCSRLALRTFAFSSVHIVGSLTSKLPSANLKCKSSINEPFHPFSIVPVKSPNGDAFWNYNASKAIITNNHMLSYFHGWNLTYSISIKQ